MGQQGAQVAGEDFDSVALGRLAQGAAGVALHRRQQQPLGGVVHRQLQLIGQRREPIRPEGNARSQQPLRFGHVDADAQYLLLFTAVDGQHLMGSQTGQGCLEVVVEGVDAALVGRALDALRAQDANLHRALAQPAADGGVVADGLGHDVARSGQGFLGRRRGLTQERLGQLRRRLGRARLGQDEIGQRAKPLLAGDAGPGAPLRPIGGVEVFQGGHVGRALHLRPQVGRQLTLLLDRGQHGRPPLVQRPQPLDLLGYVAQLLFVQCACGFLAIAGDEGDGVAVVQQGDGRGDLFRPHAQLGGDVTFVLHDGILRLRVDHTPHFSPVQT